MLISPEEIKSRMNEYTDIVDYALIRKAYVFALNKHGTQLRESGTPYFSHLMEVVKILLDLKMDQETIIGGMLHDTLEDTNTTMNELTEQFGARIAKMVNGVTKLSKFEGMSLEKQQAENFRKLLISAASDIRVLIIKLADRLHNMRTLKYKRKQSRRQFIAKETLEIYAPLAERIGLDSIKEELQDLAFLELNPDVYDTIHSRLQKLYESEKELITTISETLYELAKSVDEDCIISGRLKKPYSIWQKLSLRGITFDQISDIMAFRIIVKTIPQCYQVLGLVHKNYTLVPKRFRDYISTPKSNNYQSIHTSIIGPLNKRIEIQIRTKEMHDIAERGIAAHWNYKSGCRGDTKSSKKDILWINGLLNVFESTAGIEQFIKNNQTEMRSDKVFCITPKGEIMSLPKGASVLDFAYAIHSDVGNHAIGAKINGNSVLLNTVIENGDQIEIETNKSSFPKQTWNDFVITTKAKVALNKSLNSFAKEQTTIIGKGNFETFFQQCGINVPPSEIQLLAQYFNFSTENGLFYSIGTASLIMQEVLEAYNKLKHTNLALQNSSTGVVPSEYENRPPVNGLPALPLVHVSCCSAMPGDRIVGLIFQNKHVEIHLEDCPVFVQKRNLSDQHVTPLSWKTEAYDYNKQNVVSLFIVLNKFSGVLSDISNLIEKRGARISTLNITERIDELTQLKLDIEVSSIAQLIMIISDLRAHEAIRKVSRY